MKSSSTALGNFLLSVQGLSPTNTPITPVANFWFADLYTITRTDGIVAYWTSWGLPLTIGGNTFTPYGPYLRRTSVSWSTGLDNKQMKIILGADSTMKIGPSARLIPVIQSLAQDLFADATVRVDRLIMPTPGDTSLGTYNLWFGSVGDVAVKRASAEITVDSELILLNVQIPRTVYLPGCRHVFCDPNCTVNPATVTDSGTVTGGNRFVIGTSLSPLVDPLPPVAAPTLTTSHNNLINLAGRTVYVVVTYTYAFGPGETVASPESSLAVGPSTLIVVASPPAETNATGYNVYMGGAPGDEMLQNSTPHTIGTTYTEAGSGFTQGLTLPISGYGGYYAQGVMTFTSGLLTGLARQVQMSAVGNITLSSGFPQAPANGDAFTIRRGCARTMAACNTFSNLVNFGGFPFTPQPEAGI